ncbi:MAG: GAF domain-containing sensor histidine kinase [Ardenticatenia bacterium]|nr:GAF domain-containing sensor histidine kinase [Ardenticatenia bacterium]
MCWSSSWCCGAIPCRRPPERGPGRRHVEGSTGGAGARPAAAAAAWDGSGLLGGGLLAVLLLGFVVLVFLGVVIAGALLTGDRRIVFDPPWWLNVVALALVAAIFAPFAPWLRDAISDLVHAQGDDGYALIGRLNSELQQMANPRATLPRVARMIATDLHLPYVLVTVDASFTVDAASGPADVAFGEPVAGAPFGHVPITYLDQPLGLLVVGGRAGGRPLTPRDRALLGDVARQLGIALYAARLTVDLQASRERLVAAREEERRRIRNDLHDGLAPTLSSLQLQLGAIQRLMRGRPDEAERLMDGLRESLRGATSEIRRLVNDLRPPMLDAFGLVGALRQLVPAESDIAFDLLAPEPMPALPAAVEVAAYRIAGEAIHNVIRHSGARRCVLRIELAPAELRLEVSDDGRGFPVDRPVGVGASSMRERAAELGGSLTLENAAEGGARVLARLPLRPAPAGLAQTASATVERAPSIHERPNQEP